MAVILCPECKGKIKISDGLSGRKVRCPHCKAVAEVAPAEDSFEESPKSRPHAGAKSVEDRDEERPGHKKRSRPVEDDDDDRPRQRRRRQHEHPTKSNKGLVIGLCVGLGVLVVSAGGVLALFLLGRGSVADAKTELDMKLIGLAYHNHLGALGKPPAGPEDLRAFLAESPTAFGRLKDGQVVFLWNVDIKAMTAGSANTILAHDKDALVKGGLALFGDGVVRVLSPDEFQKTAKAQPGIIANNPPPAAAWKEYVSKSGTYTILLPPSALPKEDALTVKAASLPVFALQATLPDKSVYQVILTQFPAKFIADNPRAALLQQFRDAVVGKLGGEIMEEGNMQVANELAVNVTFKTPGPGRGYGRIFIVNHALFQMLVLGPENSPHGKDAGKFFDSFKLQSKSKVAVTPSEPPKTNGEIKIPEPPKTNGEIKIPEPSNARVGANLAKQYANAKKYREAALMFEKTAPLDAQQKAWHLKEAAVYWLKAQDKEKAVAAAKAASAGDPEKRSQLLTHFWHRKLGEVFLETGQYPLAVEHLEKAIQNTNIEGYVKDCQKLLDVARKKSDK